MDAKYVAAEVTFCNTFCLYLLLYTVLYAINLDLVMLSVLTPQEVVEEAYQCLSGWMRYSVLLKTIIYPSVVMKSWDIMTVPILMMLVLSAMEQVCYK